MSFKRDGYDINLLKNLQHRRVAEILGDHIPDDEASLLSNGKLTCTVCSKRPIFDTIQMLSLHRKGKNHLYELSVYLHQTRDLEYEKAKQTQRSFLKSDQMSISSNTTSEFPLKGWTKFHDKKKRFGSLLNRKLVLDVTETCDRIRSTLNPTNSVTSSSTSANSQVRKYLKSLCRKKPLEKTVSKLRENFNARSSSQNKVTVCEKSETKKTESKKPDSDGFTKGHKELSYQIKLLESGWIQDGNGKWIKDPNVEFDSDEDEPPPFF